MPLHDYSKSKDVEKKGPLGMVKVSPQPANFHELNSSSPTVAPVEHVQELKVKPEAYPTVGQVPGYQTSKNAGQFPGAPGKYGPDKNLPNVDPETDQEPGKSVFQGA